jgi:hypothetical protein
MRVKTSWKCANEEINNRKTLKKNFGKPFRKSMNEIHGKYYKMEKTFLSKNQIKLK